MLNLPLVTVVTVVFNAEKTIEKTILSVINQTYENIEYIIIDGASQDNTLPIIKKYEDKITYLISESDNGIYDAMNKGIRIGIGDWIIFMNSGDSFFSDNTITEFISINPEKSKNYYGDNIYFYNNISYKFTANINSKNTFLKHNAFSHQAVFYSFARVKQIDGYNINLKVSADFDLTFRIFLNSRFIKLNQIIAICNAKGFSTTAVVQSYFDRIRSFKNNKSIIYMLLLIIYYPFFLFKSKIVMIFGDTVIYNIYRKVKYKMFRIE